MDYVTARFAKIQTNHPEVGSQNRTLPRSQNIVLDRGKGLTPEDRKLLQDREFRKSRTIRLNNIAKFLFFSAIIAVSSVLLPKALTVSGIMEGAATLIGLGLSTISGAWLLAHGPNTQAIKSYKEKAENLFKTIHPVTNFEYWFGSQPVQFLFDDKHLMIAGANQQFFGYIPLARIIKIEVWRKKEFLGHYETPALWITIEGQIEYWNDTYLLIPGHFFEDRILDASDASIKFENFRSGLASVCPNLRPD